MKNFTNLLRSAACALVAGAAQAVPLDSFVASDPFILRDDAAGLYRIYLLSNAKSPFGPGVVTRSSRDLKEWSDAKQVLKVPDKYNCTAVWAPEIHKWKDAWYIFGSICTRQLSPTNILPILAENPDWDPAIYGKHFLKRNLSTYIFKADNPEGPFTVHSKGPIPPANWSTLDGTLYVEDGVPYMVFCHEWTQVQDGRIDAVRLTDDLTARVGEPQILFRAGNAFPDRSPEVRRKHSCVTDGPFLYRSKTGELLMLWSSAQRGYLQLVSRSTSGRLAGPWTDHTVISSPDKSDPSFDGGHGMAFKTVDGRLVLALHSPNRPGHLKRTRLFELEDLGHTLRLGPPLKLP